MVKIDKVKTKCCSTIGKTYLGGEKDGNRLENTKKDRYRKTFGYCNSGRNISRDTEDLRKYANNLTNLICEDNINGCNEGRNTGPMCESGGPCVKFGGENAYGLRCYAKKDNNGNLKRIDQDSKECHSERTLLATPTGN